ncbi:MAG: hypothetical protein ACPG3T_05135, partial [Pseudomonadales bacterium]
MRKYLLIGLFFSCTLLAQVTITTPLYEVTDLQGVPVEGLAKSTTIAKAMEKASSLPDGSYLIKHGDITVTVTGNAPVVPEPPVEPMPEPQLEPQPEPIPEPAPTPSPAPEGIITGLNFNDCKQKLTQAGWCRIESGKPTAHMRS